jgi:hypothetical protein
MNEEKSKLDIVLERLNFHLERINSLIKENSENIFVDINEFASRNKRPMSKVLQFPKRDKEDVLND